jgi:hypothetical protein
MRFQGWAFTQDEHRRAGGHFALGPENGGDLRIVPQNVIVTDDLNDLVGMPQEGTSDNPPPDEDPV